jgi:hypothetical protein
MAIVSMILLLRSVYSALIRGSVWAQAQGAKRDQQIVKFQVAFHILFV